MAEYPDVSRPFYRDLTKRVPAVNELGELAMVRLTPFGKAVSADLNNLKIDIRAPSRIVEKW